MIDASGMKEIPEAEYAHLLTPADEFRLNRYTDVVGMTYLPQLPKMAGVRLSRIVAMASALALPKP